MRTRTRAREEAFAWSLASQEWSWLKECHTVDRMTDEFEKKLAELTEQHFPLARVRKRSNEDPWISRKK